MPEMPDTTILYYTANLIPEIFADNIRERLRAFNLPVVSVSQEPLFFGENICVGKIGVSIYNVYRQLYIGAQAVKTKWIACCEDDCLYHASHINFAPPTDDSFYYNVNRWNLTNDGIYYWRKRINMGMCICSSSLLLETLKARLEKYPDPSVPRTKYFSEPGKYEQYLGLDRPKCEFFNVDYACISCNHRPSLGGVRKIQPTDYITLDLPGWGPAEELWNKVWGEEFV